MSCPPKLSRIVAQFEPLPEDARRANLVAWAEQAGRHEPCSGETFDLEDVRKDEECTDTVGIFLKVDRRRRNYDGSWTEWGNKVRAPIERE